MHPLFACDKPRAHREARYTFFACILPFGWIGKKRMLFLHVKF